MRFAFICRGLILVGIAAAAGCTVHDTSAPSLSGPSALALTLRVNANPDTINQDGGSRSTVTVTAIGPDGRAAAGVPVRMDIAVGNTPVDFGTLSARTIMTGSDGTASVLFTAPPAPVNGIFLDNCADFFGTSVPGSCVSIVATASGSNFAVANPESVRIRLVPVGVILPPATTPTAAFTVTPSPVQLNLPATFDGSASAVGSGATSLTYSWSFGDGGTATGAVVTHTYTQTGTFSATLTVTNDRGLAASKTQSIAVGASPAPTGDWVFSPTNPFVGDDVTFNAAGVRPVPGRTITSYRWDFNDGSPSKSGMIATHAFSAAGTFNVVLSVTDDAGQTAVVAKQVPVGAGNPVAVLTVTKTGGLTVNADGSGSTAQPQHTILNYTFLWGDGNTTDSGQSPSASHTYTGVGTNTTFTVTLRVRDELGRVGTTVQTVTLP